MTIEGSWRITEPRPGWPGLVEGHAPRAVRLRAGALDRWDSSLPLFVFAAQQWARDRGIACDTDELPAGLREVLGQLARSHETSVPVDRSESFLTNVGLATADALAKTRAILDFVGECVLAAQRVARQPGKFRWGDCLGEMQQCGAMALPIGRLTSKLTRLGKSPMERPSRTRQKSRASRSDWAMRASLMRPSSIAAAKNSSASPAPAVLSAINQKG